jgi:hypothetical protein
MSHSHSTVNTVNHFIAWPVSGPCRCHPPRTISRIRGVHIRLDILDPRGRCEISYTRSDRMRHSQPSYLARGTFVGSPQADFWADRGDVEAG